MIFWSQIYNITFIRLFSVCRMSRHNIYNGTRGRYSRSSLQERLPNGLGQHPEGVHEELLHFRDGEEVLGHIAKEGLEKELRF